MKTVEMNFDGLIGPTHNYAGLAFGNLASTAAAQHTSSPKQGALQGLEKMRLLHQLGVPQGILPPLQRPYFPTLKQLGFSGTKSNIIKQVANTNPTLLASCYSASSMWVANAATVSASQDCQDGKLHFTPANLISQFHRSIEPHDTAAMLKAVFAHTDYFVHHPALPPHPDWADEGAANHTRLSLNNQQMGLNIFVYGQAKSTTLTPHIFPARQRLEASQIIAQSHGLTPQRTLFLQQSPQAIDQGVFHNDVICVGHKNCLFYHQHAFADETLLLPFLTKHSAQQNWQLIRVLESEVSIKNAVESYLFNSQIVTTKDNKVALIAPQNCARNKQVSAYLIALTQSDSAIDEVHFVDLDQSMNNGGGPACLRLRVCVTEDELAAINPACHFNLDRYEALKECIERTYPDRLTSRDLGDPALLKTTQAALTEVGKILGVSELYQF
ncbi:N-succinylarginine dihydrolase [Motilimonas sp. 1_MG-2023]|uniref:N-succinylarginine dihydrolase n=1 Tax=Motilimonas sp. 1_MG-2023 TaxID=3062672 RepID=UPI0026E24D6B|nr:N-succinylarginine dihydrolase [Motilimonas sp. 1_MG-2023]MDO6525877.1 N-succinylarginine dihydrolase [Motilimonas sp. 1_MG-2023]